MDSISDDHIEILAEVAHLYYEKGLTQAEIGHYMNLSHASISRFLKEAHNRNIVEIRIRYPIHTNPDLEESLVKKFGLKQARVLTKASLPYDSLIARIGQIAAKLMEIYLEDGMTMMVSWGQTVLETVKALQPNRSMHIKIIQGEGVLTNEMIEGSQIVRNLAELYGNDYLVIHSPMILKDRKTCQILLQEPSIKTVIKMAEEADIALVGIGSIDPEISSLYKNKLVSEQDIKFFQEMGAVGELLGRHFDKDGKVLDIDFNHRVVGLSLDKLKEIPIVIGVAANECKIESALATLRGGYVNMLVTDSVVADYLIKA
jgi:Transcriptional regulator, contains sigma factor-related N-terminal domain